METISFILMTLLVVVVFGAMLFAAYLDLRFLLSEACADRNRDRKVFWTLVGIITIIIVGFWLWSQLISSYGC